MDIAILEQTTLPRILVHLYYHNKACRLELKHYISGSQDAIYRALDKLKDNELIIEELPKGRERRIDVYLSEKGKLIAEKILEIEKL